MKMKSDRVMKILQVLSKHPSLKYDEMEEMLGKQKDYPTDLRKPKRERYDK